MVVLAHPNTGSLCHRLAGRIVESLTAIGAEATLHDLYVEGFDPVLLPEEAWQENLGEPDFLADRPDLPGPGTAAGDPMVVRHRRELERSGGLVVVHPDWWGKPPAILTGWLDRVLVPVAGTPDPGRTGLHRVLVVNTTDDAPDPDRDPLGLVWRQGVGTRLATDELERMALTEVAAASPEQHQRWFAAVERAARWVCGGPR